MSAETPSVSPALTHEEWFPKASADWTPTGPRCSDAMGDFWIEGGAIWRAVEGEGEQMVDNPHGLAALCLYGQAFGFTREDVDLLNKAILQYHWREKPAIGLQSLASRIAALLPPETPE